VVECPIAIIDLSSNPSTLPQKRSVLWAEQRGVFIDREGLKNAETKAKSRLVVSKLLSL
jgi:hypothetical protein